MISNIAALDWFPNLAQSVFLNAALSTLYLALFFSFACFKASSYLMRLKLMSVIGLVSFFSFSWLVPPAWFLCTFLFIHLVSDRMVSTTRWARASQWVSPGSLVGNPVFLFKVKTSSTVVLAEKGKDVDVINDYVVVTCCQHAIIWFRRDFDTRFS